MRTRHIASLLALALACLAAIPAGASAKTTWLCGPGVSNDPCKKSLTATEVDPNGETAGTQRTPIAKKPKIDCFYVYPTTSDDTGPQADLSIDPELRAIALYQASRFSEHCRVYAPVYRQITLRGLLQPDTITPAMRETAYADVKAAWEDYLENDNKGRGVVLIGHSQGASVLRRLVEEEIDGTARVQRRLVSALLIGSTISVMKGRDSGGNFVKVPACRKRGQIGCVIAYNTFGEPVPDASRFGRVAEEDRDRFENLCTNPAFPKSPTGRTTVTGYNATSKFPGTIGILIDGLGLDLPDVSTPWTFAPKAYAARCVASNGAIVLRVSGGPDLKPQPDVNWGLHLTDMNIAMGNLVDAVGAQEKAYLKKNR
jgi:hypothetical protein